MAHTCDNPLEPVLTGVDQQRAHGSTPANFEDITVSTIRRPAPESGTITRAQAHEGNGKRFARRRKPGRDMVRPIRVRIVRLLFLLLGFGPFILGGGVLAAERAAGDSPDLKFLAKDTPAQIAAYFASPRYERLHRSDAEFVRDVYRGVLRREPDPAGAANWVRTLASSTNNAAAREGMVKATLASPEYRGLRARDALRDPSAPDAGRNPANRIFDRTGVFVNDATAFPLDAYESRLKTARIAWIAIQIDHGGKVRQDVADAIQKGWMSRWKAAGFEVGFWGCPRGVGPHTRAGVEQAIPRVKADAALAVSLCKTYHADLYIADLEDAFQGYHQGDPTPELNRVYVSAFKAAAAAAGINDFPRALSSEGRIALDMRPWIDEGWDAMPQAYWCAYAVYQPSKCVDFYVEAGWPIGRIHPTIGTFTSEGEKRPVSLAQYDKDLRTRPTTGFSFYLPESYLRANDAAYRELARMGRR